MNKIYKVIFNKAKGCYEVVSELAKNNGKAHSTVNRMGKTVALSTLVALSLGMAAIPLGQVDASLALNSNGTLNVYQTDSKGNYIRDKFGNLIPIGVSNQQTVVLNANLHGETFASATGARSIAIGEGSNSSTSDSIAIGTDAKSINGTGAVSLGWHSTAQAQDSVAIGSYTFADTVDGVALGHSSHSTGASSIAIGSGANATREYSAVLGANAKSTTDGGVALGANSISDRQDSGAGVTTLTRNPYIPTGATETQRTAINNTVGTTGAVSVGSSSGLYPVVRRQIINVAAGSADSDAVNVAQLKAAVSQATNSTSVANGDNTTVTGSGSTSNPYRVTANTDNTTIATINNKGGLYN